MKKLKDILSWIGFSILLVVVVAGGISLNSWANYKYTEHLKNKMFGDGWYSSGKVMLGTTDNLGVMPRSAVFDDATTTDPSLNQGGLTLTQVVDTFKLDGLLLNFKVKAGTATSTILIRQMGSQDGTNYYDVATSTLVFTPTSTPISMMQPRGAILVPNTVATTSMSIPFDIFGYRYTRFIMYNPDVTTDPNDVVYAYILATRIEPITR